MMVTAQDLGRLAEFLAPARIAVVATISKDGTPQLTPNWYWFDGKRLHVSTTKSRWKYKHLARDPRMAVLVYSGEKASDYVALRGRVEVRDGEDIWPDTRRIVERYVSHNNVESRLASMRKERRVVLSLTPERVAFRN
jgi:PPOX class probable F420-dependent enzyme